MKIINRLPIGEEPRTVMVESEPVLIRRYQIAIWVRLRERSFPAVLDTGHTHNFALEGRVSGLYLVLPLTRPRSVLRRENQKQKLTPGAQQAPRRPTLLKSWIL
jgi:hypothetical protein